MCLDAHLATNPYGDLIAETESSYLRLAVNQAQAGYSVVIAKRHAPEIHLLTPVERDGFFRDVAAVGEVLTELLAPVKLANLMMGFRMPHLHCHVIPQYRSDDPFGPLNPQAGEVRLSERDWSERLSSIRSGVLGTAAPRSQA